MRTTVLSVLFILSFSLAHAQNTDLPSPTANNQTLPSGSYVIAMDNTNQLNGGGLFNYSSYGLIVTLLNNSKKLKWVITAGKAKDGIDFTVNAASLIPVTSSINHKITTHTGSTAATVDVATSIVVGMYVTSATAGIPAGTTVTSIVGLNITLSQAATANIANKTATFTSYSFPVTSYNFKAGHFVIFAADTSGVGTLINTYNSSVTDAVIVYKTSASVTVDIRYDLSGYVPKAAILNDGGNQNIHVAYMTSCSIPSANYQVTTGQNLLTDCFTFASEPHNSNSGQTIDDDITAIKRFVRYGGNFLAECAAIINYENNALGRFQTTTGITQVNSNAGTSITYPNPDLSFSQYEGVFNISIGGSLQNWRVTAAGTNNFHKHTQSTADNTVMGTSVSKLKAGYGGLVFYIGNHTFNTNDVQNINGIRQYMNAFLTPVSIAGNCSIGISYMNALALKLASFDGVQKNSIANLSWEVMQNESVKQFVVEWSTDGFNFTPSGVVYGTNRTGTETYQYSEPMPGNRIYYHLKMIDTNGVVRYSRIIILQTYVDDSQGIKIITNPVNDRLVFDFTTHQTGSVNIRIIDMLGQVQMKQVMNTYDGANRVDLTLPYAWQNGVYLVEVIAGHDRYTAKFVKQQ